MRNKTEITQAILEQMPEEVQKTFGNLNEAMMYLWMNFRESGGLRLTKAGYEVLTKMLKLESWAVDIDPRKITKRTILQLDRKLTAPYYISARLAGDPKIILFSSRETVMVSLYGGIIQYLERST